MMMNVFSNIVYMNDSFRIIDLENVPRNKMGGADLQGTDLQGANLQGADLQGANLQGALLDCAILQNANLQGANISHIEYSTYVDFRGANLTNANLKCAQFIHAKFSTNIIDTPLEAKYKDTRVFPTYPYTEKMKRPTIVTNANFEDAILDGSDFRGTQIQNTNLTNAQLDVIFHNEKPS